MTARLATAARWTRTLPGRALQALIWPFRTQGRLLTLAWTVGLLIVGNAHNALAAVDDGFITPPDLGSVGGETFFERFGTLSFTVPVDTDSDHDGSESYLWNLINAITNLVLWFGLTLLRGALVALQWMLNLDIYDEQSAAIDDAMASINTGVFLPLVVMTIAVAGFSIYARARRDGGGILGEVAWMLAAAILAFTLMAQPSKILGAVDEARVGIGGAMMTTYSEVAGGTESSTGYVSPDTGGGIDGAIRALTDSLWNTYGVSGWCYVAWGSVDSCQVVGQQYLEDPAGEDGGPWGDAREALRGDGDVEPFGGDTSWVRGQEPGRLGAALLIAAMAIAAAIALFALFAFGLMAVLGVIILILVGAIFLAFWIIPGKPRQLGVGWLQMLLGTFLQSVMITAIVGAVMVTGSLFNAGIATYGILMTAAFNVVTLFLGLRYRAALEHMLGMGTSATGTSAVSSFMAMRALSAGTKLGKRSLGGAINGTHAAGRGLGVATAASGRGLNRAHKAATNGVFAATGAVGRRGQAMATGRLAPLASRAGTAATAGVATVRTGASDVAGIVRSDVDYYRGKTAPTPATAAPVAASAPAPAVVPAPAPRMATPGQAAQPAPASPRSGSTPPVPPRLATPAGKSTPAPATPGTRPASPATTPPAPPAPPATSGQPQMAASRHYKLAPVKKGNQ